MTNRLLVAALLAGLGAGAGCAHATRCVAGFAADAGLHPYRQPVLKNPQDYGMAYEDVAFKAADGVDLKGWVIPGSGRRLALMTHPMSFTRYGFAHKHQNPLASLADFDVEFLKTARQLHDAGWWVVMFDFRNHGESGTSANNGITGVGMYEWQDVVAALDYAASRADLKPLPVALVTFCQGANAAIVAFGKAGAVLRERGVKALVAVQPISVRSFAYSYGHATGMGDALLVEAEKVHVERGGLPWADMSPGPFMKDITVPTLFVQARGDPWTDTRETVDFYDHAPEPKEFLWLEGRMHRFDSYNYFGEHPERLLEFLGRYIPAG